MRRTILAVATTLAILGSPLAPAAEPAPANTMRTVFVNKNSPAALTKAVNAMHAQMEAEGWTVHNTAVYTEDGDLEGLFVTYVRAVPHVAPAAHTAPAAETPPAAEAPPAS